MIDLIKKTMYMGLGLAYLTKEKVEEISRELVKKGELSEREGRDLVDDLAKKSEEAKKALDKRIDRIIKDTLDRLNVATKDDLKALEKKLTKPKGDS
ncbi:MAG: polyhydroxyalkanoate synthesis regulator [PVC group bacterium]